MSNTIVIKNMRNQLTGTIRTQGTVTRLNDRYNRTVATYNSGTNVTVDTKSGKAIGFGNQLLKKS